MSYHKTQVIGYLGRDPEMRYTPSGQAVTNFSVAVNDDYTNSQGEKVERVIWYRISTWGKLAEVCNQYLQKGRLVFVEGRLIADQGTGGPRVYTRNDGTSGASFELNAQTVRFLGKSNGASDQASEPDAVAQEDEIPF
jgi:single-strand DNA-binding protein